MAYSEKEARELVVKAGNRLVEAGLIARTWGNISARISDTEFVITPSGMAYDRLTPEDIVKVNIADCSYEGDIKPSSEKGIHAESYKYRSDVNFVIHTHQLFATAYGTTGEMLHTGDRQLLGNMIPCAEYGISSTKKLMHKVSESIQANPRSNAFFMRYHGVLCLGKDIENAFDISLRLEELCKEKVLNKVGELDCGTGLVIPDELVGGIEENHAIFVTSPAIFAVSRMGKKLYPMIDDMAQIGGTSFDCIRFKDGWAKRAVRSLKGKNAVLIRNGGAVCTGNSLDEAEAVASVLEKNCLAKLYSDACFKNHRLNYFDALLQRKIYLMKYSKLKDK